MNNEEKYVDHLVEKYRITVNSSIQFSLATIKASLFINGGALVALLTFVGGSAILAEKVSQTQLVEFFGAFEPFIYGVLLATIAYGISYIHTSATEYETEKQILDRLFPKKQSESKNTPKRFFGFRFKKGNVFYSMYAGLASIFVIGSLVSFAIGAFSVVEAMKLFVSG